MRIATDAVLTRTAPHGLLRCRDCRVSLSEHEARRTRTRLERAFPGISDRHAYCEDCADLVQEILSNLGVGASPARGGGR